MRVLVTGAAGSIGRVVTDEVAHRSPGTQAVGLDRVPRARGLRRRRGTASTAPTRTPSPPSSTSRAARRRRTPGRAPRARPACPTRSPPTWSPPPRCWTRWSSTTSRRIVYASSNHAVGRTPRPDLLGRRRPPRPDTFYGVGKVAAEALLQPVRRPATASTRSARRIGSFRAAADEPGAQLWRPGSPTTTACGCSTRR